MLTPIDLIFILTDVAKVATFLRSTSQETDHFKGWWKQEVDKQLNLVLLACLQKFFLVQKDFSRAEATHQASTRRPFTVGFSL